MSLDYVTSKLFSPTSKLFSFQLVNEDAIFKIFDKIPHENSTGVDDISAFLMKSVKFDLLKAVTTTVNQSLTTGIFPDNLKLAKVITFFKKGDQYLFYQHCQRYLYV